MFAKSYPPRHRGATLVLFALAFLLTGCFTHNTVIRVSPDGSGVIEQRVVMLGPMLEMMQMFAQADPSGEVELYSLEELESAAATLGEDVRFTGVEPLEAEDGRGYVAYYAFDDVRTLAVSPSPGSAMPDDMPSTDAEAMAEETTPIRFDFEPGSPARLTVLVPTQEDAMADADTMASTPPPDEASLAMMRDVLKGAHISLVIELDGAVTDTDATYADGNTVTLMEMDFDAFLQNDDQFKRLAATQPQSMAEAQALLQTIDGVKVETQEQVQIRFE